MEVELVAVVLVDSLKYVQEKVAEEATLKTVEVT